VGGNGVSEDRAWASPGRAASAVLGGTAALVLLFLVLPVLVVVPLSFSDSLYLDFPPRGFSLQWYERLLGSEEWTGALWTSLRVGVLATLIATALGTAAALALARSRFRGKALLVGFLVSPMIVPVVVLAIALYAVYARLGLAGAYAGLVLAHAALGLPFVIVTVSATLTRVDPRLEQAALSLGATPWRTFRHVLLPLVRPGVITGALLAFITSWDEVVVALFVGGTRTTTLPRRMWEGLRSEIDPTLAAASTLLVAVSLALMVAVAWLRRRAARMVGAAPEGGDGGGNGPE
jgi:putative spermidine/putrescine transport system permease protein